MYEFKKSLIKLLLRSRRVNFYNVKNSTFKKVMDGPNYKINSFGRKNPNKIFYVIKRIKGGGLFSNMLYVLNHLILADKLKAIPVIDMENFTNLYNEKNKIDNSYNSWEYYFEPVSKYKLKEVYKSKFVIFCSEEIFKGQSLSYTENTAQLRRVFLKYIKIKKKFLKEVNNFVKKYKINKSTLGIHWRGTDHKVLPGHPLPPTETQILNAAKKILDKHKLKKIFLITEQNRYFKIFLREYRDKLVYFESFRSDRLKDFSSEVRKNHKYNLGRESLIETLVLSNTKYLLCSRSNISEFANFISTSNMKVHEISNGYNSNSIFFSLFKWNLLKFLPNFMGGFKQ